MQRTYPMAIVSAPGKVEFQDRKLRRLSSREVLIGVKACAICGSDLHIFKGKHPSAPLPVAIGHEVSGVVLETGSRVARVKEGDRVVVEPVIVCGKCYFCQRGQYSLCTEISFQYRKGQGGFAPCFIADETWTHPLPEKVSFEEGALIEPLSVAIHAVEKSNLRFGDRVAVFGAGAIGLLVLMLARSSGAAEVFVTDVQAHRLKKAKTLGASHTFHSARTDAVQEIFKKTEQLGVDRSFEAVGLERTLVQSLQVLRKGGASILVGIFEIPEVRIPANLFIQREISLLGSQGYCWDFQKALKMMERGNIRLKELITHVVPMTSLQEGFELLMNPQNKAIKVIITMD